MPKAVHFAWLAGDEVRQLIAALGPDHLRFVGGCVRDSLLDRDVFDIDAATDLAPDAVMQALKAAGIKVVPTGIEHGTVTAVVGKRHFEITTLRHDVETHGRRADVAFHSDWEADAARRDFTMNALYLDAGGNLYDYFDGRADLDAGLVRFIGDAGARIREDGLRIMRFFRFHARYGIGDVDAGGLAAVRDELAMLDHVSAERVRDELLKILRVPDPVPTLAAMRQVGVFAHGVLGQVFGDFGPDALSRLVALGCDNLWTRLATLLSADPDRLAVQAKELRLANKHFHYLYALIGADAAPDMTDHALRVALYKHGLDVVSGRVYLSAAPDQGDQVRALLATAESMDIPVLPISGKDLIDRGFAEGRALGDALKQLEQVWIDSDFTLSRDDLLKKAG